MGMALTPCTVPAAGEPTFELGEDEMEIGIGIHGEPGRERDEARAGRRDRRAAGDADRRGPAVREGDKVLAFVNGMGGTPLIELYIVYSELNKFLERPRHHDRAQPGRHLHHVARDGRAARSRCCKLDDELTRLWDAPVDTPALRWGAEQLDDHGTAQVTDWMRRFAAEVGGATGELTQLDTAIGDGDHGTNMDRGMRKAVEKLDALERRRRRRGAEDRRHGARVERRRRRPARSTGRCSCRWARPRPASPSSTPTASPRRCDAGVEGVQARGKARARRQDDGGRADPRRVEALAEGGDLGAGAAGGRPTPPRRACGRRSRWSRARAARATWASAARATRIRAPRPSALT